MEMKALSEKKQRKRREISGYFHSREAGTGFLCWSESPIKLSETAIIRHQATGNARLFQSWETRGAGFCSP
jgi:hypothetical protein